VVVASGRVVTLDLLIIVAASNVVIKDEVVGTQNVVANITYIEVVTRVVVVVTRDCNNSYLSCNGSY